MNPDRNPHAPAVAPGEPETPVAGNQPPAPEGRAAGPEKGKPVASHGAPDSGARDGGRGAARERAASRDEAAARKEAAEAVDAGRASADERGAPADERGAPADERGAPTDERGAPADERGAPTEEGGAPAEEGPGPADERHATGEGGKPREGAPEIDHERKLELDLEKLTTKAQKADAYLELAQRTKADFENYRKRAVREAAAAQERGVTRLALELLPAVDNLDRALMAAETGGGNGAETLVSGIKLVHADVIAAFGRLGIESYSPVGERFDPQCHEAVAQQPVQGAEPGTVVEVYQRGYRLGDVVIRPARVVVAG